MLLYFVRLLSVKIHSQQCIEENYIFRAIGSCHSRSHLEKYFVPQLSAQRCKKNEPREIFSLAVAARKDEWSSKVDTFDFSSSIFTGKVVESRRFPHKKKSVGITEARTMLSAKHFVRVNAKLNRFFCTWREIIAIFCSEGFRTNEFSNIVSFLNSYYFFFLIRS